MPLIYDEEIGELVNVCIDCGDGPCSTFNDRCLRCHEGRDAARGAGVNRQRCCEAACPEHPTLLEQVVPVVLRTATGLRALAWWAVRSVVSR